MVWAMRDLPMPGSPEISTTQPSPAFACSQRRISRSISSSRPTSGVVAVRSASKRLSTALAPQHLPGPHRLGEAFERRWRRDRDSSKRPPSSLRVLAAMTTVFGSAMRLQPRRKVRRLADDRLLLRRTRSDQIADDDEPGRDADARLQAERGVFELAHSFDQLQPGPHRPLGVVLMGLRIAEIDQHAVAHVFRDEPAEALHGLGDAF